MPTDYVRTDVPNDQVPRVEKQIKDQAAIDGVTVSIEVTDNGDQTSNLSVKFGNGGGDAVNAGD